MQRKRGNKVTFHAEFSVDIRKGKWNISGPNTWNGNIELSTVFQVFGMICKTSKLLQNH